MLPKKLTDQIEKIDQTSDKAIEKFEESIPATQRRIFRKIRTLLMELDVRDGKIRSTASNIRKIRVDFPKELRNIVQGGAQYKEAVNEYLKSFDKSQELIDKYYAIQE